MKLGSKPDFRDQSHRIWQRNGSAVEPPGEGRQHAGTPFRKPVPPRPLLAVFAVFCSEISTKLIIGKLEIRGYYRSLIPMLRILANAGPLLPKPKLLPVPPVLSGPDQARFFVSHASRPPERLKHRGRNAAIIGYAHDDNSRLIGAVDPNR